MQSNIYAQKENGDLRLIAEIEGLSDPALAVDALLDEMPRMKQRQFIVIDVDNVMLVEAGDDIVQPRRQITVTASNGAVIVTEEPEEDETEAEDEVEPEAEAPAPKPRRGRARTAAKTPATRARGRGRSTAKKAGGKTPFKKNLASAE
jgi:hypothetical protein